MKRHLPLASLLIATITIVWLYESRHPKPVPITAIWLQPKWSIYPVAQTHGKEYYRRGLRITNDGGYAIDRELYTFLGNEPSASRVEKCAEAAIAWQGSFGGLVLQPRRATDPIPVISNPEDPTTEGLRVFVFTCPLAELRRRIDLQKRYPLLKILWPLPHQILDIAEFDRSLNPEPLPENKIW